MKIVDQDLEPYSILIDSENFTVGIEKEYDKKDGEKYTVQQNQTFHTSIESAIRKIIKYKMAEEESVVTLEEYFSKYQDLLKTLADKFSHLEKLPKERREEE